MSEAESRIETLRDHEKVHWHRASLGGQHLEHAERIVSLVPSLSESLVLLGLQSRLIGVTEYCVHPADAYADLPRLGGTKDADVEAILALRPDLVIANQEENTARVVGKLARAGIDVWVTYPRTVEEGVVLLEDLAALGADPAALETHVTPARQALDRAEAAREERRTGSSERPTVFCPIWRDPWMTINEDTYIHDLIDLCGGENLFASRIPASGEADEAMVGADSGAGAAADSQRRYPIVALEALVAVQPEVILLPDEPYAFGEADRAFLAELDVPAARSGKIHLIDGTLVSWYGPRITESIRVLAGIFANL